MGFSDCEFEVMRKYRESRIIDEEDKFIVDRFRNTGLMNVGYTENPISEKLKKEHPDADIEIKDTAVLTEEGKKLYVFERMRRSPIRRFFFGIAHSV